MSRTRWLALLAVAVTSVGCDAGDQPTDPLRVDAAVVGGAAQEKIGAAVLAALDRGETPAIIVALDVVAERELGVLRQEVRTAQDAVLRSVTAQELGVRRRYQAVPAFSAIARNRGALQRLAAHPLVRRIDLDLAGGGTLAESVPLIAADARHAIGNRGAGVVVAILDTGIDTDHPDLADALVHQACFGDDDGLIDGAGFCPDGSDRQVGAGAAEDDAGHGTHVSGIVASNGTVSSPGVAPAASIVSIKVLNDCSFSGCFSAVSEIIAALDYIIDNPDLGVGVISMSLGTNALYTGDCDAVDAVTMAAAAAVNTLRNNGVTTFAASGNDGSDTQMPLPACVANVVSVGSVDDGDVIAASSNHTATTDILAPGVNILSLGIGGGTQSASGTSMASPTAAGCAALLIEAGDATTPDQVETRLETSSVTATRGSVTLPRIDCSPDIVVPPGITVDQPSVAVNEGTLATNTGTFTEGSGGEPTLSASVGTAVAGAGTWSWSFATTDGPSQSQSVTITATATDASADIAFDLVVSNVAPTVAAGPDATMTSGETFSFSGTFSDPGVNDAPWDWVLAWGTGPNSSGSTAAQASPITAEREYCAPGDYTITLSVTDKDDDTGVDSRALTVEYLAAGIEIMPMQSPNVLNLSSGGLVPVAVLGGATFDVRDIDPATLVLGDESGTDTPVAQRRNGRYYASLEDVNRDGYRDLVLHFEMQALVANDDVTEATLSLALRGVADGCTAFRGTGSVKVVP